MFFDQRYFHGNIKKFDLISATGILDILATKTKALHRFREAREYTNSGAFNFNLFFTIT